MLNKNKYDFDMVVIGGGAAGLTSSGISASFGAKTALIEAGKLGGDCTWYGCVPSKTLLKAAKVVHYIKSADRFGLRNSDADFHFSDVMAHVHDIQEKIYREADAPPFYEKMGVSVINGRARFLDDHHIEIRSQDGNVQRISSRYFIIAAGSRPAVPNIDSLSDIVYLTNETVFSLEDLPEKLVIVGAGPIGTEMAYAFRRLGSEVVVIDKSDRILTKDDTELSNLLREALSEEGVQFIMNSEVAKFQRKNGQISVTVKNASGSETMRVDGNAVLLAVGRQPSTEGLNLEAAGVAYDKKGIKIDKRCRTSAGHIYACGDVAGDYQFTHFAEHMAKVAVSNAILHFPASLDSNHITWCTYTEPELAHVGASEQQLQQRGTNYELYRFPFSKIDRAITESETTGWIKVFAKKLNGKIYGVSILGVNAGEMIGEYALAMRNGVTLRQMADTMHPYPTYVLGNRRAADQWYVRKQSRTLVRWLQRIFGYRGQLPDTSDRHRIL